MSRTRAVLRKEWLELRTNRTVLATFVVVPLLLLLTGTLLLAPVTFSNEMSARDSDEIRKLAGPMCEGLSGNGCAQLYLGQLYFLLFLTVPTALPSVVASYSVVGEKTERTLEPLLATPVTSLELLGGKALAAVIPAVGATWVTAGLYLAMWGPFLAEGVFARLAGPAWFLGMAITAPLLSVLSVLLAILVSSRTRDPRTAQQISGLVVLPILGFVIAQTVGAALVTTTIAVVVTGLLAVTNAVLLWAAITAFGREHILTRWTGL